MSGLIVTVGQPGSDLITEDFQSFRRQELCFALLNFFLIGALLTLQEISRFVRGRPTAFVLWVLMVGS